MYYRATIVLSNGSVADLDSLSALGNTLASLFGAFHTIAHGCVEGEILMQECDIESIHALLEDSVGVDIRIGIARTPSLASIALLWGDRPGITYIDPAEEDTYLAGIPVDELDMVPTKTARQMRKFQIFTAYDIKYSNAEFMRLNFDESVSELRSSFMQHIRSMSTTRWYKQLSVSQVLPLTPNTVRIPTTSKRRTPAPHDTLQEQLSLFTYAACR
jgi:hypothetical protein